MAAALRAEGFEEVEHVPSGELDLAGILAAADAFQPDVALVDLHLGAGRSGLSVIGPLAGRGVTVFGFTASDDPLDTALCLEAGAVGVFLKSEPFEVLVECVRKATAGHAVTDGRQHHELLAKLRSHRDASRAERKPFEALTRAEQAVLERLVKGDSPHEIADDHTVSVKTIRSHIESIHRKLGVNSQLAAVALAREVGWTPN